MNAFRNRSIVLTLGALIGLLLSDRGLAVAPSKEEVADAAALWREVRFGKDLRSRVASAQKLLAGGDAEVVPLMVRELGKPLPKRHYDPDLWADDAGPLIEFLGACGDLRAMQALAIRLPQLTPDFRALIVAAAIPKAPRQPWPAEVEALGEKIAVSALDDRALAFEPWPPSAGNSGGTTPEAGGSRVCDVAAAALARRWPDRYPLVDSPAKLERDTQLARFRNTWRIAQGLKALPAPERSGNPAARDNANVIAEFRWIGGEPVAGFPGKLRQPRDSSYPFPVEAQFAMQVGQPLTGKAFLTGVEQLQRALADECLGIAVSAERLGDRRGIVVEIERLGLRAKSKHAMLEMVPKRDLSLHAVVNGTPVAQWDEGGFDGGQAFFHDEKYAKGMGDALQAAPDAIVGIYFQSALGQ